METPSENPRAEPPPPGLWQRTFEVLSSFGLTCVILVLLGVLTWLGTLEQVHRPLVEVQKEYFESFVLIYRVNVLGAFSLGIPLPGATLLLMLLFVNLVAGGIVRMRKSWARVGILITHVGIGFLLLSGFVKLYFSDSGQVTLFEGERAAVFSDFHRWEIAVTRDTDDGRLQEFLIPQEDFQDARTARPVTLHSEQLPFDLEVSHYMPNCLPQPRQSRQLASVPVVEGFYLEARPPPGPDGRAMAGIYATAVDKQTGQRHEGILWGLEGSISAAHDRTPWTVGAGGERWAIELRHARYPLPFGIQLVDFLKEDHPGTTSPKWFSSDILVLDDGAERPVQISMNEPLRKDGHVVYQTSWGPQNDPGATHFYSVLEVARNPSDKWPLIACIIIAVGLVVQFISKLHRFIHSQVRTA